MVEGPLVSAIAPEYKLARSVLLDALEALGDHGQSVVLVGAQAVYVHAGQSELSVALMTTDSDLVLRVSVLDDAPDIAAALEGAAFARGKNPGSWLGKGGVAVDLMVAPHESNVSKKGARAAALPGHDKWVARITPGLEPALVDYAEHEIAGLDDKDRRTARLNVAGPAALIAAKLTKIFERVADAAAGKPDRVRAKDALDTFRLLQEVDTAVLAEGFATHAQDERAALVSLESLRFLRQEASAAGSLLPRLVSDELGDQGGAALAFVSLAQDLLDATNGLNTR